MLDREIEAGTLDGPPSIRSGGFSGGLGRWKQIDIVEGLGERGEGVRASEGELTWCVEEGVMSTTS